MLSEDSYWNLANMIYGDDPVKIREHDDPLGLTIYTYKPDIYSIRQSSNLYVYCINNPVKWVDPSGDSIQDGLDYMKQIYESFPGLWENTKTFATNFGNRIPDIINNKVVGEIKYVNYQYLSSQIKGMIQIATEQGKQFILIIDKEKTAYSAPLAKAIYEAKGQIVNIANGAKNTLNGFQPIFMFKYQLDAVNDYMYFIIYGEPPML